ncbi:MAG: YggS family pyridoxal phosphate-dependent enzyme, partial [Gammaproteobacteria bacterium]|nr:YggS family pyridoxal phosphate-dependent enzyme [Gammaproteobacteria bacterium]
SRKAKLLLPYHCIESVDRVEIVEELDKRASNNQKSVKILVEINIGREPQKFFY